MANEHWKLLLYGRIQTPDSPEKLLELCLQYFQWCDNNGIQMSKQIQTGKKAGDQASVVVPRPYHIKALCLHCGISEEYIKDILNTKDRSSMYYIVIQRIMYIIYSQNLELATVGVYNAGLTIKLLGIDKEEQQTSNITVNIAQGLPPLSNSENDILEKLDFEIK